MRVAVEMGRTTLLALGTRYNKFFLTGTTLRVMGTTSAFNGLYQIDGDDLSNCEVVGQGAVPDPQTVTLADIQGLDGEAMRASFSGWRVSPFPMRAGNSTMRAPMLTSQMRGISSFRSSPVTSSSDE